MSRMLDLDNLVEEQDEIMKMHFPYENRPDCFLQFATARMIKTYLLKKYAQMEGKELTGEWVWNSSVCGKICSICYTRMEYSRTQDGHCSICSALNK